MEQALTQFYRVTSFPQSATHPRLQSLPTHPSTILLYLHLPLPLPCTYLHMVCLSGRRTEAQSGMKTSTGDFQA